VTTGIRRQDDLSYGHRSRAMNQMKTRTATGANVQTAVSHYVRVSAGLPESREYARGRVIVVSERNGGFVDGRA